MLCCVLCCGVCGVVCSVVCVVWHAENPVCPFKTYTRARFEWTHGGEGEGHRQFCLPKFAHIGLSRDLEVHQK